MLLKRFFKRTRTRSSSLSNKQTCLCTTAKRDSFYDDPVISLTKNNDLQLNDQYGFIRTDKPRRIVRQISLDESDGEDNCSIAERLRRASSHSPANIPMLVVVSFNPTTKGLQKNQIEIQRGFPVNAQYILNEWLYIKTADNDEGFVPYLCCRPMLRHQSIKCLNNIDNSYKPYDFQLNKILSPTTNRKLSVSTTRDSQTNSSSCRKRQDLTTSSCAGDSGVSDCESSSNNHFSLDLSKRRSTNLLINRSSRSSSNTIKTTGLIVQDIPIKKPIKSQLSISSNSAFTQITKQNQHHDAIQHRNNRSYQHGSETALSSTLSFKNSFHRPHDNYIDTRDLSSSTSKYSNNNNSLISSPYIRRTPYTRRSLPHNTQSILKKVSYTKSSSSPNPFKIINEQQFQNYIYPDLSTRKVKIERHFSDLSLNQIENDSLSPASVLIGQNQPSLSFSSSSSTTSSSIDDNTNSFSNGQINNYRSGHVSLIHSSTNNSHYQPIKSTSFIHNVSITV